MQQIPKTLTFLTDQVFFLNMQAINENLVRINSLATHFRDPTDIAKISVKVREKKTQSINRLSTIFLRSGARDQQNFTRNLSS